MPGSLSISLPPPPLLLSPRCKSRPTRTSSTQQVFEGLRPLAYPCLSSAPNHKLGWGVVGSQWAQDLQDLVLSEGANVPKYSRTWVPSAPPAHPSPKVTQPHVTQEVILESMYRPLAPVNSPCTRPCNMRGLSLAGPGALLETARSSSTMSRPTRRPSI